MKRTFTIALAFVMAFSLCLPVQAGFSFQEDTPIETSDESMTTEQKNTSEETSAKEKTSAPAVSESSLNESSDNNAVGDNSAYYGLDDLGEGPDIDAESAIVMDASSGAVLYKKDSDSKQYPASITKVMTALLAIENCGLNDIVTFSSQAVNGIEAGSSSAGINVGAKLTVEDTLYALMLVSANEAAAALAEHISGSDKDFAKLMNKRAKELGCTGTHFTNPHGLPDEKHYTTAHDMGLILKQAIKYDAFRKIASADTYTLKKSDTLTDNLELWNHAKILRENSEYYYKPAEGAKTGYTQAALNTLVTYAKKGNVELLCVILKDYGAASSYHDTAELFKWGFEKVEGLTPLSQFNLNTALSENKSIKEEKLNSLRKLNCTFPENYYILVKKGFDSSALKTEFVYDEDIHTGKIGYINILSGDTVIGSAPVTYDITTENAQSYLNSGKTDDNLETAPISDDELTPTKVIRYLIRVIIAFIIIFFIMSFIHRLQAEKRRKQRIKERKRRSNRRK